MTAIWKTPVTLDFIKERGMGTMAAHLGIEFTEIGDDYMIAKMPVDERTKQPIGIMHGGASCVLAETVGSVAANFCVDLKSEYCVGLDINTNHLRVVRGGYVYGKTTAWHIGKKTQVWNIEIRDDKGALISINRLTMMVMQR